MLPEVEHRDRRQKARLPLQPMSRRHGADHIERTDDDEWSLQATLVGQVVRSVKKRLTEYASSPPPEERRDPAKADALARCGTS